MPRLTNIKLRRGAALEWETVNPVLDDGELGYDKTNKLIKIGNGIDPWNNLLFIARTNPVLLEANSSFIEKLSIRSSYVDFTQVQSVNIFSVPEGYFFLIDALEIITTQIQSPGVSPVISFGNNLNYNEYCLPTNIVSSSVGDRHIIENPQNAASENLSICVKVHAASSSVIHGGFALITGNLIKI